MSWRDIAGPIIFKVLDETKGKTEKEIKKALFDAYPFGERNYHPYKIWLNEIKRQRNPYTKIPFMKKKEPVDPNQIKLI